MRLMGAEHHAHQRLFFAVVKQTAVNSRRHRDQIAFAQQRFRLVVAVLNHQSDLPFEHEEHLFYVIMQVQRAFTFGRQHTMVEKVKCSAGTVLVSLATPVAPVPM